MNCHIHPDRPATAYCRTCGRALCAEDQREIYGVVYCQECLARPLGGQASAAGANPYAAPGVAANMPGAQGVAVNHSPGAALLLGLIPGVGAVYNGQYLKAFVQVVVFAFLIALANWSDGAAGSVFAAFGIAAFYFYMLIDSYRTAKQMASGQPVHDMFGPGPGGLGIPANTPVAAIVLIAIGGIFLLRSMGFFYYDLSRFLWPGILIAMGVFILMRQKGTNS